MNATLIEDLLTEGNKFVLTNRFQTDPLEKLYGQYRQMFGGRFLDSFKDVSNSENVLKVKSLVKAGFDISDSFKVNNEYPKRGKPCLQMWNLHYESSREISNHVVG